MIIITDLNLIYPIQFQSILIFLDLANCVFQTNVEK